MPQRPISAIRDSPPSTSSAIAHASITPLKQCTKTIVGCPGVHQGGEWEVKAYAVKGEGRRRRRQGGGGGRGTWNFEQKKSALGDDNQILLIVVAENATDG